MSKATKKKYVTKEVTEEFILPDGDLQIVKVLSSKGNNLHEVTAADSSSFLVSMPTKFRKNVWIKRGDYVMVKPIEEGDKVKAEITHILYKPQIAYIQSESKWPASFSDNGQSMVQIFSDKNTTCTQQMIPDDMLPPSGESSEEEDSDSDDSSAEIEHTNPNRVRQQRIHFNASDDNDDDHKNDVNDDEGSGNDDEDDCNDSAKDVNSFSDTNCISRPNREDSGKKCSNNEVNSVQRRDASR